MFLKMGNDSAILISIGKSFHSQGAATAKARSPYVTVREVTGSR